MPNRQPDERPDADAHPLATFFVLVTLPTILFAGIGWAVGYDVNGIAGAIAAGLFVGFTGFLIGISLRSIAGPIARRALPGITLAVLLIGLTAYLVIT